MVEPSLQRKQSTVPTACMQTESTVIDCTIGKAWDLLSGFRLDAMCPGAVTSVEFTEKAAGMIGACAKVTYKDGAVWTLRFDEWSEKNHSVAYELMSAEPSVSCTSVQGEISLKRVTMTDGVFISWLTEFSNDADLTIIQDSKYKKQDMFSDMAKTLGAPAAAATETAGAAGGGAVATGTAQTSIKVHAPPGGKSNITF